jgi:type II secretory pathway pseudopilin PulG
VLKTLPKLNLPERPPTKVAALSLFELLIVIAVLAVLATLLIPYISPMQRSTQEVVARQQQAALQAALGNWISAASSQPGGLAGARSAYSGAGSKLALLQNYLQPATYDALTANGNSVTSAALSGAGASLQFSDWGVGGTPTVNWINAP